MRLDFDTQPSNSFVDNALLTGLSANYDAELAISHTYEELLLGNAGIYGGLIGQFDAIQLAHCGGNLSSQTLDEFMHALNSLIDVQSAINDVVTANRQEREDRPKYH
jgi:hypothetical protein